MDGQDRWALDQGAWMLLQAGRVRAAVGQWSELNGALRRAGRYDDACAVARTMVAATAERADVRAQLIGLYAMAETAREAGQLEEAERALRRALELHQGQADRPGAACDLALLGELAEAGDDLERAVQLWSEALGLLDVERSAESVHDLLLDLARAYSQLGNGVMAATCADGAERLAHQWAQ